MISFAQEIIEQGSYYGLKYFEGPHYSPVFTKIESKNFFYYGKKDGFYYNLSRNADKSEKAYKKFEFHLLNRLLVVGKTADGKVDIMDETGQFYYLENGDYNRVHAGSKYMTYQNDDLLFTLKKGKKGLYNWVKREEILPSEFDKIKVHESCLREGYFIFAQQKGVNKIINEDGEILISFSARIVTDMYPAGHCRGYILESGIKKGYCAEIRKNKYFLIKPRYDEIMFFPDYPNVIIVRKRDRYGLYYRFRRYLKPKYHSIDLIDDPYILARITKRNKNLNLMKDGTIEN